MPPCRVPTPRVTVVVVTWNGAHLLDRCLASLEAQTLDRERYEVVVVDNASTDGTPELLAQRWPQVVLLRNDANLGFAGGCNTALRWTSAPFVMLVNNDAELAPDVLERMLAAADAPGAEDVAALTARVLLLARFVPAIDDGPGVVRLPDGRCFRALPVGQDAPDAVDLVNSTGSVIRDDGRAQDRGWLTVDGEHDFDDDVFGFCGAAALLRMDAVRPLGGFDDRWFLYYEDVDLGWRLRLAGWRNGYVRDAVVRHAHSQTTGEGSALHAFHDDRNRLLTLVKDAPAGMAVRVPLRHAVSVVAQAARGLADARTTWVRLRALLAFLALLPHALRERRTVGRTARVDRREVARLFVPATPSGGYRT